MQSVRRAHRQAEERVLESGLVHDLILRKKKPTFARPAPDALRQEILDASDVVIEALAD